MTKIFMLSMLFAFTVPVFAQSIDDINKLVLTQQYAKAKTSIDQYLSDPKNAAKGDGWYYKGRIYNALSFDSTLPKSQVYELKSTAYDAFLKSQSLDAKDVRFKDEDYRSYLDLYFGMYDLGVVNFNKKDFDASFNSFKKAGDIKDYIISKKYTYKETTLQPFDTSLVLNTAIAAAQSKKEDQAAIYYQKLVDAGVTGDGYQEVYQTLADYYLKSKDQARLDALITKAKATYPNSDYWDELSISAITRDPNDKTPLYAKYDELLAKNPNSYLLAYNYAVEYYNSLYGKDAKPKDIPAAQQKLTDVLKTAIKNDKGIDATVLMTNHLYNIAADYSSDASMAKGTKPEDVKKKAELKKQANAKMDEMIPYAESALKYFSAQPTLKPIQKANQKIIVGYLVDVYGMKNDPKKVAEYQKINASL